MEIIKKEQLEHGTEGTALSGIILIKNYNISLTKTGKEYINGTLQSGKEINFKVWGNASAFNELKNNEYTNVPSYINGKYNLYNGELSIIVETCQAVEGYEPADFLPVVYNIDAYWNALKTLYESRVSDKAKALANKYLFDNNVSELFKSEFAAASNHDNCKGGLLAHTYKMLTAVNLIFTNYPKLFFNEGVAVDQDFVDLIFFGAMMHDIGKVREMHYGVYTPEAIVTHRYLGIEHFDRADIIANYSEIWYYNLVSIMLQHHGEFDDECRTLAAWIVHKADMLDSEMTLMQQNIDNAFGKDNTKRVKYNGKYLTVGVKQQETLEV